MIPDKMDVEDLLSNESFMNYCNQSSQKDVAYWENYVRTNSEKAELIKSAKEQFVRIFIALASADLEEQAARLYNSIDVQPAAPVVRMERPVKRQTRIRMLTGKITAAIIFLTGAFFTIRYLVKDNVNSTEIFEATYGEKKNIQLSDGSYVMLNAGSTIKIKNNFGITSRDVFLQGEAFFDVTHNAKIPFIVHTPVMDVKAVGTAFDVKAYRNESITETSLLKGVVEVTLKEDNYLKMLLYPNEKIKWKNRYADEYSTVAPATKTFKIIPKPDSLKEKIITTYDGVIKEVAWKANKLVFENDEFGDIALLLERWYEVKINFEDDTLRNYRFTGIFEKEKLTTILDFLKESRDFNYVIENGKSLTVHLSK